MSYTPSYLPHQRLAHRRNLLLQSRRIHSPRWDQQECTIEHKCVFPAESDGLCPLPQGVTLLHTGGTGPVPCGDGSWLVCKKDTVFDVIAFRNPAQGALAIEPPVSLVPLVTAQCSWSRAFLAFAIGSDENIGFHRGASVVATSNTPRVSTAIACARSRHRSRSAKHWHPQGDDTARQLR